MNKTPRASEAPSACKTEQNEFWFSPLEELQENPEPKPSGAPSPSTEYVANEAWRIFLIHFPSVNSY